MPLCPDVVQHTGTNPTLRNYGLSALFTCSFCDKMISHNNNSHTLLAGYHTSCASCVHHTGCLRKKSFPQQSGTGNQGTLRDGQCKGEREKQSPFPGQEEDLNPFLPIVRLGIFSPGKESCCFFPSATPPPFPHVTEQKAMSLANALFKYLF